MPDYQSTMYSTKPQSDLRSDFLRLRKQARFHLAAIVILLLLVVGMIVAFLLNIKVTPYQTGQATLFQTGAGAPGGSNPWLKEIDALKSVVAALNDTLNQALVKQEDHGTFLSNLSHREEQSKQKLKKEMQQLRTELNQNVNKTSLNQANVVNASKEQKLLRHRLNSLDRRVAKLKNLSHHLQVVDNETSLAIKSLDKELKTAKTDLLEKFQLSSDQLTNTTNNIESQIEDVRAKMLQAIQNTAGNMRNVSGNLDEKITAIHNQVNSLEAIDNRTSGRIRTLELDVRNRNDAVHDLMQKASTFHANETGKLRDLVDGLHGRLNRTNHDSALKLETESDKLSARIADVGNQVSDLKQTSVRFANQSERLQERIDNVQSDLLYFNQNLSSTLQRTSSVLDQRLAKVGKELNTIRIANNVTTNEIRTLDKALADKEAFFLDQLQNATFRLARASDALSGRLNSVAEGLNILKAVAANRSEWEQIQSDLAKLVSHVTGNMTNEINVLHNKSGANLEEVRLLKSLAESSQKKRNMEQVIDGFNKTLINLQTNVAKKLTITEKEVEDRLREVERNVTDVASNSTNQFQDIRSQFHELITEWSQGGNLAMSNITNQLEALQNEFLRIVSDQKTLQGKLESEFLKMRTTVETLNSTLRNSAPVAATTTAIGGAQENFSVMLHSLERKLSGRITSLSHETHLTFDTIRSNFSTVVSSLHELEQTNVELGLSGDVFNHNGDTSYEEEE